MMPDRPAKTLIISDGSLASLVATAMVSERSAAGATAPPSDLPGIVWGIPDEPASGGELWSACERAAAHQADLYGLGYLPQSPGFLTLIESFPAMPAGQPETTVLMHAAYLAAQHACPRVIWAVQHPYAPDGDPDLDAIARSVDRAVLVGRLISLDLHRAEWVSPSVPELTIETPFVDLTDEQLADLSRDLEVPVETCWWWGPETANLPGAAQERARWAGLVRPSVAVEPKPAPASTPVG